MDRAPAAVATQTSHRPAEPSHEGASETASGVSVSPTSSESRMASHSASAADSGAASLAGLVCPPPHWERATNAQSARVAATAATAPTLLVAIVRLVLVATFVIRLLERTRARRLPERNPPRPIFGSSRRFDRKLPRARLDGAVRPPNDPRSHLTRSHEKTRRFASRERATDSAPAGHSTSSTLRCPS